MYADQDEPVNTDLISENLRNLREIYPQFSKMYLDDEKYSYLSNGISALVTLCGKTHENQANSN